MSADCPREALLTQLDLLLQDYRDVLDTPPTSLEAARMLARAHPAVIRGFSPGRPRPNSDYSDPETYIAALGERSVTIAITDDGLADSVRILPDGTTAFVKPFEEKMPVSNFLNRLQDPIEPEVLYLQSQDGNIFRSEPQPDANEPELAPLQAHFVRDIPWMQEATGSSAEAVNFWVGSSRSTTSLHHDPYENIYHVLSGSKTFTLISPIEGLWLNQRFHPPATLHRDPADHLLPVPDPPLSLPVPWVQATALPPRIRPIIVTLQEGETLYLPAGWWHRVEQAPGKGGLAVAINYWYPAEIRPETYALSRLSQRIARMAGMDGVIPVDPEVCSSEDESEEPDVWGDDDSAEEWMPDTRDKRAREP